MKYKVVVKREFTTWIEVDADSKGEAQSKVFTDTYVQAQLYEKELEQCNAEITNVIVED